MAVKAQVYELLVDYKSNKAVGETIQNRFLKAENN